MKNEADFKRIFKMSVRKHKGYCLSLAAPMISGLPDLYCIMPGYIPVLLEAKYLGEVGDIFKRKIQYRPLQKFWLDGCNKIYQYAAWGLVGFFHKNMYYCCLIHPEYTHIDSSLNFRDLFYVSNVTKKEFNLTELFEKSCIGKIEKQQTVEQSIKDALDFARDTDTME